MRFINKRRLNDSTGAEMAAYVLTLGTAVFSETIKLEKSLGDAGLLVTGDGDVDLSYEISLDGGTTFFVPYDTDGQSIGNIREAWDGNLLKLFLFQIAMGIHIRLKFDPDANSTITADFVYLEED